MTAFWLQTVRTRKIEQAKIVLACWDAMGVSPQESSIISENRLTEIITRVRAVPMVDPAGPRPEASVGEHCLHCYKRMHCPEYLLPMAVAIQAGVPAPFAEFTEQPLTVETTVKALVWLEACERMQAGIKKIHDLVEGNVDAYVTQEGPVRVGEMLYGPTLTKPRKAGATVETLKAIGREDLIRMGDPKVKCKWYPAPK